MRDKDQVCPVCGGKLYKVHRRLICGRCPYGLPWWRPSQRKPVEKKAA